MKTAYFDDAWEELKNQDNESQLTYGTAEEVARIIVELIEARVERGYSQRDLAGLCGIKQSAIARMESIESIPRLDTIIRVATALEMTMDLQTSKTVSLANAIPLDSYRNLSYTDNAFSTYKPTTMKFMKGIKRHKRKIETDTYTLPYKI